MASIALAPRRITSTRRWLIEKSLLTSSSVPAIAKRVGVRIDRDLALDQVDRSRRMRRGARQHAASSPSRQGSARAGPSICPSGSDQDPAASTTRSASTSPRVVVSLPARRRLRDAATPRRSLRTSTPARVASAASARTALYGSQCASSGIEVAADLRADDGRLAFAHFVGRPALGAHARSGRRDRSTRARLRTTRRFRTRRAGRDARSRTGAGDCFANASQRSTLTRQSSTSAAAPRSNLPRATTSRKPASQRRYDGSSRGWM